MVITMLGVRPVKILMAMLTFENLNKTENFEVNLSPPHSFLLFK